MLQEIVARSLALEPGSYKHFVGSLHLYETDRPAAKRYLAEGWQQTMEMPPMPDGNPWPSLRAVMASERTLRSGAVVDVASLPLDEYWKDLIRLLQVYRHFRDRQPAEMARVKRQMSARVYDPYITSKQLAARRRLEQSSR
jgi:thymidylate synthase